MIIGRRHIDWDREIPWGWGVSYAHPRKWAFVCYPIPFNWVVRWSRSIYFKLQCPRFSWLEDRDRKIFEAGIAEGARMVRSEMQQHEAKT